MHAAVLILVVRPLLRRLLQPHEGRLPGHVLPVLAAGVLASGYAATAIGLDGIFGAFAFGLVMPRDLGHELSEQVGTPVRQITALLMPVFFVTTGLCVDITRIAGGALLVLAAILAVACLGKMVAAYVSGRLIRTGHPERRSDPGRPRPVPVHDDGDHGSDHHRHGRLRPSPRRPRPTRHPHARRTGVRTVEEHRMTQDTVTGKDLRAGFEELGLPTAAVVIVHASLSAFGRVDGGAATVLGALRDHLGPEGTVVVPTFTGDAVRDPHPDAGPDAGADVDADRAAVPLFHDALPTLMGALPTAVLADPDRLRSTHPQASVAAVGARAREITARQPFAYAVGPDSPFDRLHDLGAHILLLGVGHNRNSFLHYAESLIPDHRRKLRRFPYVVNGERVWVEVPDVGDDNGRHFPGVGAEAEREGLVRTGRIGGAECRLTASGPFVDFARRRLAERLRPAPEGRHGG